MPDVFAKRKKKQRRAVIDPDLRLRTSMSGEASKYPRGTLEGGTEILEFIEGGRRLQMTLCTQKHFLYTGTLVDQNT